MVVSIAKGSNWRYYAASAGNGEGNPNYYSAGVSSGEPAGRWRGSAAERVGLVGVADDVQLEALFGEFIHPQDPSFTDKGGWDDAERLGRRSSNFKTEQQILGDLIAAEGGLDAIEPERLAQLKLEAGGKVREAVSYFDVTYSPQKSVSVAYTAFMSEAIAARGRGDEGEAMLWEHRARVVEEAVWEASGQMLDHLEKQAGYTRTGYHGGKTKSGETTGKWANGKGFIVASFLQHTSRPVSGQEAPQLHVHNLVLNRIEAKDGKWRTLDGQLIYKNRASAGAVADRVLQARLSEKLGVSWGFDPQSKAFEIKGISRDVRSAFSPRRQAISALLPEYVAAFERASGRQPNALELSRLAQQATLKSRVGKLSKEKASTLERKVQKWTSQAREETSTTLGSIARTIVGRRVNEPVASAFSPDLVVRQAVADVQETKAVWTRSDLMLHLHRHLPAELAHLDADYQERVLNELADLALRPNEARIGDPDEVILLTAPEFVQTPPEFQLDSGESAFRRPGSEQYATRRVLDAEARIEEAARAKSGAARVLPEIAAEAVEEVNAQLRRNDPTGRASLSDDQAAILSGVLSSGARSEVIVGPAGTGKSYIMGVLGDQWERRVGGRVYGLTTAEAAAKVLAEEGLANASNIKKWLDLQTDIDDGDAPAADKARWRLRRGDLVIVDEASMVDSMQLAAIQQRADETGAKLLLVGDHHQLGAVGAGGAFTLAQDSAEHVYELREVRRFRRDWEKAASLRLREGDAAAALEYDAHGRLIKVENLEGAYERATEMYVADTLEGRRSYLIAGSNEEANDLGMRVRDQLVRHGLVEERGVAIGQGDTVAVAGAGDVVQGRRNNRRIGNGRGQHMTNRGRYVVAETHEHGGLTVQALAEDGTLGEPIEVPAKYARRHLSLGYASTQHGAQGGTGYSGYGIVTPTTSASAAYVMSTRGTDLNLLFVVDSSDAQDLDQTAAIRDEDRPSRSAATILAEVIGRDTTDRSATQTLRDNLADAGSMRIIGHRLYESRRWIAQHKWETVVCDLLGEETAERFREDPAATSVYRLLEAVDAAGLDVQETVADAIAKRELGSAESIAQVLHWRISGDLDVDLEQTDAADVEREPAGDTYTERIPEGNTRVHEYAREWAYHADHRVQQLGEICANRPPQWALQHLGAVPEDPLARQEWIQRAGTIQAYRETYGISEDPAVIGRAPTATMPERHEEWHAAWRAMGRPEPLADERQASEAELLNTVQRYDAEKALAPPAVAEELREVSQEATSTRTRATMLEADLAQMDEADERRAEMETTLAEAHEHVTELEERRDQLEYVHQVRTEWHVSTSEERTAALAARRELERRTAEAAEQQKTSLKDRINDGAERLGQKARGLVDRVRGRDTEPEAEQTREADQEQERTAEADTAEVEHDDTTRKNEADTDRSSEQQRPTVDAEQGQEQEHTAGRDGSDVVQAAFPPEVEQQTERPRFELVDISDATARADETRQRLQEREQEDAQRAAAQEAEREAEAAREREAAEAAREAIERERDEGLSL